MKEKELMKELIEEFEYCIEELCRTCKQLNPQHSECTSCSQVDDFRNVIKRINIQLEVKQK